jgi:two-component system NtrC family sensor kinase
MLATLLGPAIEIAMRLPAEPCLVNADASQFETALINMATNARDAMHGKGKIVLNVAAATTIADTRAPAAGSHDLAGNHDLPNHLGYVGIAVSDTGIGIPAARLERIFEPFFTTKQVGHGTGLGLSQVYGFVKQSKGHVKIYSEPGEGTSVKIYLPRLEAPPAEEPKAETRAEAPGLPGETILVVEDDEEVRAFTVQSLAALGYRVLQAPDAAAALAALEKDAPVDLLFTDVVLPGGVNGRQLADEARQRKPGLKALFTTGYAPNAIVHQGRLDPDVDFIGKPFVQTVLAGRIRQILDRSVGA